MRCGYKHVRRMHWTFTLSDGYGRKMAWVIPISRGYGATSNRRALAERSSALGLIENLGEYPFAKEIGLIFAARRVIRDIQPHMQNIANRYTVMFDSGAEDCFGVLGHSQEHIRFATGRFQ